MSTTHTVPAAVSESELPLRDDCENDALMAFVVSHLDAQQARAFRRKMAELDADRQHHH